MRNNPSFAATAIVTLAIGIGGNTALFTVIRSVLLKPLDYREPDRLVQVSGGSTEARFEEMRAAARSFSEIGAFTVGMENVTLSGGAGPETLKGARVSANFLDILGVRPVVGRSFILEEDTPGGAPVAMISNELWKRRFGGDAQIAGKTAVLAATPYTIIGVLPRGFQFPFSGVDVWVTRPAEWSIIPAPSRPLSPILNIFGRLKPQVDIRQASAELAVLNHQYAIRHPGMLDAKPNSIERVTLLKDEIVSDVRSQLWLLFGAVGFVLLIACANVASLLLARATSRSREFAVRAALGAERGQLMAQLLAESVVLAIAGGILGVILAQWSLSGITSMSTLDLPRIEEIRLDGWMLGFALLLSSATGVLFGLVPSLGASRPDLAGVLRTSGEAANSGASRRGIFRFSTRGLLVVGQVALSIVLLIGATLLMESLAYVRGINPGFQAANLLTMQIALPPARYDTDQKKAAFFEELVRRVEALPGVRSAAATLTLPMTGFAGSPVQVVEQPPIEFNERPIGIFESITPQYFRTLEIPLRRGREFTAHDIAGALPVAIISESLARRFWPAYPKGQDPVGQHLLMGANAQPVEIAGIVADVHQAALDVDVRPEVYRPCAQSPPQSAMFAVRTEGDPLRYVNPVRREVLAMDRDQPVSEVQTMDDVVESSQEPRRLMMMLLAVFAGVAVLLAAIGIYGVIAYSVVQRTKEMGIRRALGAQQSDILWLMAGQGLGLTLAGVALGLGGAFALTGLIREFLFHVGATDPATFAGIALLFLVVACAASYAPARRAMRIDPMAALRAG